MTVNRIVVDKPLLKLGMILGEGCVWDTRAQVLYFVDIDGSKVYAYDPVADAVGEESFSSKITALALLESGRGLLCTTATGFAMIPPDVVPVPGIVGAAERTATPFGPDIPLGPKEKRFNDAAVDPAGRFLAGTMGYKGDEVAGKMYALQRTAKGTYEAPLVLDGITCSNGTGWSPDGKTMYLTDSWTARIEALDYDVASGRPSNRRTLSHCAGYGEPDGLCMDAQGGMWSARWESGTVLRIDAAGTVTDEIVLPTVWCATCVVFGGRELDELYVTTADSGYNGAVLPERFDGGNVFVVKNVGYTGVERGRFRDI